MQVKVLIVDNYDSFTYNLYQAFCAITSGVQVFRNDKVDLAAIEQFAPDLIVISPGPKEPKDAGISKLLIEAMGPRLPILGVCLGHQCINEVYGGRTVRAAKPWHGKTSRIQHDGLSLFEGLPQNIAVAQYNSLQVDRDTINPELAITAWTEDGSIMGLRHRTHPVEGVQFHPESFMTEYGQAMLDNFCRACFSR